MRKYDVLVVEVIDGIHATEHYNYEIESEADFDQMVRYVEAAILNVAAILKINGE